MIIAADLPTWIAALSTLGAFVGAGYAAAKARDLYLIESAREVRTLEAQRRAQAEQVSAWVVAHFDANGNRDCDGVVIVNDSTSTVFDVAITFKSQHRGWRPLELAILPPGRFFAYPDAKYPWSFPDPMAADDDSTRPIMKQPNWLVASLALVDGAGRAWIRDERGQLAPRDPDD